MSYDIPSPLRIGYQDVKVQVANNLVERHLDECDGFYDRKRSEIFISEGMSNREILNTVIHECLHAMFYTYGMREIIDDKAKEEYIVNTLGNALTQFFVSNPVFAEWVVKSIDR